MMGRMITVEDVRRVALSLPATSEKPSYGRPGFRVERAPKRLAAEFDARLGGGRQT
jgi:hypothetical protein